MFGPGSSTDTLARIIIQDLSQTIGQPIAVVNKPGADGSIAAIEVKRSAPDGYTFFFGTNSPYVVVPNLRKEPPYDTLADFAPVTMLGDTSFLLVVHPSIPAKTLAELVAYAKANPKKLNYASGNTFAIVATAMIAKQSGIEMLHAPYKTEPEAITDLLSGQVHVMLATPPVLLPHVLAGKLTALGSDDRRAQSIDAGAADTRRSGRAKATDRAMVRAHCPGRHARRRHRLHEPGICKVDEKARQHRQRLLDLRRAASEERQASRAYWALCSCPGLVPWAFAGHTQSTGLFVSGITRPIGLRPTCFLISHRS
ncbi:MAG: tripartite tricarboxylate transporter substrate binding protein [Burkholderiaceae bacterium]